MELEREVTKAQRTNHPFVLVFIDVDQLKTMNDTRDEVAERFGLVNTDLAASRQASITTGMSEVCADDSLQDLIQRADDALYTERRRRTAAEY